MLAGSTLQLNFASFTPTAGEFFDVAVYNNLIGSAFSFLNLSSLPAGFYFSIDYANSLGVPFGGADSIRLTVVQTPEPQVYFLLGSLLIFALFIKSRTKIVNNS